MDAPDRPLRFSPSERSEPPASACAPSEPRGGHRRRRLRVVKPRIQYRLVGACLGFSALSLLLQFLLFGAQLAQAAADLPDGGAVLVGQLPRLLGGTLLVSAGILFPLIAIVGVLYTGRFAGPLYRFEVYLREVVEGRQIGPCRLREGDELQELSELITEATEPARRRLRTAPGTGDGDPAEAAPGPVSPERTPRAG